MKNDGSKVIRGKDDWLFLIDPNDGHAIRDFQRRVDLTPNQLLKIKEHFKAIDRCLAAKDIPFLIVLAPNKESVYPENYPDFVLRKDGLSMADQLLKHLSAEGLNFLDLRAHLMASKETHPLYFKADTHWNQLGAFRAYEKIMQVISSLGIDIGPILKIVDIGVIDRFEGDLVPMIGQSRYQDKEVSLAYNSTLPTLVTEKSAENLPAQHHIRSQMVSNPETRLVVFRDSFASALIPLMATHFSEANFFWQNQVDTEIVEKYRPNVVVLEFVERHIPRFYAQKAVTCY